MYIHIYTPSSSIPFYLGQIFNPFVCMFLPLYLWTMKLSVCLSDRLFVRIWMWMCWVCVCVWVDRFPNIFYNSIRWCSKCEQNENARLIKDLLWIVYALAIRTKIWERERAATCTHTHTYNMCVNVHANLDENFCHRKRDWAIWEYHRLCKTDFVFILNSWDLGLFRYVFRILHINRHKIYLYLYIYMANTLDGLKFNSFTNRRKLRKCAPVLANFIYLLSKFVFSTVSIRYHSHKSWDSVHLSFTSHFGHANMLALLCWTWCIMLIFHNQRTQCSIWLWISMHKSEISNW